MSYSEDALKAKLSTLNETQESIVATSQWIMFYKRHADRIASYWLTRLRDSPPAKRLNFIYLVNDIVQNARMRKRSEFPDAFSPLMPEAIQTAYRSSTPEIQNKIRRVVEVWRTRNVFETPIQEAIEGRIDDVDKTKTTGGKKTLMGNSIFTSSSTAMPKELESLAPLQVAVTKETIAARPTIDAAQSEYTKLNDPNVLLPKPPVHAARLSGLIKSLASAESAVSTSIKARQALIADLERILDINKSALAKDQSTFEELQSRKASTEAKKREVEDGIIRGLSSVEPEAESRPGEGVAPEIEELTPEPDDFIGADQGYMPSNPAPVAETRNPAVAAALAGFDYDPNESAIVPGVGAGSGYASNTARVRSASGSLNGAAKRRKVSHGNDDQVPDLGEMGMEGFGNATGVAFGVPGAVTGQAMGSKEEELRDFDAEVDELVRQEGGFV